MQELTIEEKIAQMLIIALQEKEITQKTIQMIQKYKIGGIILYRKNYKNYQEMLELVNKLRELNRVNEIPLFISIDQEGGRVNRMPSEILKIKSPSQIAHTEKVELVIKSANIISKLLKETGININYSPVLDIKRFEEGHAIGDRCYGENKDDVSKYGIEFMKESIKEGILPVVKHFPGHGTTTRDSHILLPIIKKDIRELEKEDMEPFKQAIKEGADGIMVGHMLIKGIDKKYPASLSEKLIKKYLIDEYNYQGLIFTDDLKMKSMRIRYSPKRALKQAINAGNNIIMMGIKYKYIERAIKKVAKQVRRGKVEISKIDNSVEKILQMKNKYKVNDNPVKGFNIEQINKEIEELNSKIK